MYNKTHSGTAQKPAAQTLINVQSQSVITEKTMLHDCHNWNDQLGVQALAHHWILPLTPLG